MNKKLLIGIIVVFVIAAAIFFLCGRLSGSDLSGLDILGICGLEKEN